MAEACEISRIAALQAGATMSKAAALAGKCAGDYVTRSGGTPAEAAQAAFDMAIAAGASNSTATTVAGTAAAELAAPERRRAEGAKVHTSALAPWVDWCWSYLGLMIPSMR